MALKFGDRVKLHKNYDESDPNRLWTICEIDWAEKTFTAKKSNMGGNRGKLKTCSLNAIDQLKTDYQSIGYICYLKRAATTKTKVYETY